MYTRQVCGVLLLTLSVKLQKIFKRQGAITISVILHCFAFMGKENNFWKCVSNR